MVQLVTEIGENAKGEIESTVKEADHILMLFEENGRFSRI